MEKIKAGEQFATVSTCSCAHGTEQGKYGKLVMKPLCESMNGGTWEV